MIIIFYLMQKLRCAVAKALEDNGISVTHKLYQPCGAKLLTICRTFIDVSKKIWLLKYASLIFFFFFYVITKYTFGNSAFEPCPHSL